MRESYGADGKEYLWEDRELLTYEELFRLISERVKVDEHPVPDGCVGDLYTVAGVSEASRAVMRQLGHRVEALKKKAQREDE